jgi:hypothetical protein
LRGLKRYGYDIKNEERQLNKIVNELGLRSGEKISQRISKIGIKNLKSVTEQDLSEEAEIERDRQFSANANINDTSTLLNMGNSPKADIFK